MSQPVSTGIAEGARRNQFGRPTLVPVETAAGPRQRCTQCRALVCPECSGCHCAQHVCSHTPHRCCGGGAE